MKHRGYDAMSAVSGFLSQPALRRLQLRMRPVLRSAGRHHQTRQGASRSHAGGHSPVQAKPATVRDSWFAERENLGTPLSDAELRHGVDAGLISSALLG